MELLGSPQRERAALSLQKEIIPCWGNNNNQSQAMEKRRRKKKSHFVSPKAFLSVDIKSVEDFKTLNNFPFQQDIN